MSEKDAGDDAPPMRRVVIVGASNVVRGISTIYDTSARCWGTPLDFLVAHGHGRSYGGTSYFLGRGLPGIRQCGLWSDLKERPPAPTAALLTDVGNDILYGFEVERIGDWVDQCLSRMAACSERVIVTELPVHDVERITARRYNLVRALFFPQCRLPHREALDRALRLNELLCELAERHGAVRVKPLPEWFGLDPIHIRLNRVGPAWSHILASWSDKGPAAPSRPSLRRWLLTRWLRPQFRRLFGFEQRRAQPAARLPDGGAISYY
ncbi:MAG: hypothetical protein RIC55_37275 [Pirellulaceae bacterium]